MQSAPEPWKLMTLRLKRTTNNYHRTGASTQSHTRRGNLNVSNHVRRLPHFLGSPGGRTPDHRSVRWSRKARSLSFQWHRIIPNITISINWYQSSELYQDNELLFWEPRPWWRKTFGTLSQSSAVRTGFFNDSIVRPYIFNGTITDFLTMVLSTIMPKLTSTQKLLHAGYCHRDRSQWLHRTV